MAKAKTKTGNPFLDGEFGNVLDFTKVAEQFKLPGLDSEALIESQRRNIEAVAMANRVAFEGTQAVFVRQAEILRQALENSTKAAQELAKPGQPADKWVKQTELLKDGYELALSNLRELTEISVESSGAAAELLSHRFVAGLDEIKGALEKTKGVVEPAAAVK